MSQLSKEALVSAAAAAGMPREVVPVPEFGPGIELILQGMSGTERDAWEKSLVIGRGKRRDVNTENVRAKLVVRCLVDEHGSRIFSDGEAIVIGTWRVDVLNRLYEIAQRLNGVSDADVDELKNASGMPAGSGSPTS